MALYSSPHGIGKMLPDVEPLDEWIHIPRTPGKVRVILHKLQTKIRTKVPYFDSPNICNQIRT